MMKRLRVLVRGDVQGVGFRWYCRDQARTRGVGGFVRNRSDGSVEAAFEGESEAVDAMVEWCRSGPRSARVDEVEVYEEEQSAETEFRITRI
jgi:acylphosphatase